MSWCGGGLIRPTPGVECRVRATHGYTFAPGSWPPSPGLAPCAILIWMSSALTRYSLVTPNRPLATCFTALRRRASRNRSASSPPAQAAALRSEPVDRRGVAAEHVVAAGPRRVLQEEHRLGVEQVYLTLAPPL